jgi:hypothetical protein
MEKEEKALEPETEEVVEVKAEEVEVVEAVETEEPQKEKKVIDGSFFNKLGNKIKAKVEKTRHNMLVASEINRQFAENASRYTLLDTAVKGLAKILMEKDEEAKTFTFLGKLKLKDNAILKDKEGNLYKVTGLVEGEHTRVFTAENEEHERELTVYSYIEI